MADFSYTPLTGNQIINAGGIGAGTLDVGDAGSRYNQDFTGTLILGTPGGTEKIYVTGQGPGTGQTNIDQPINLNGASLEIIGRNQTPLGDTDLTSLNVDGFNNGVNFEITHATCILAGNGSGPLGYTGTTTLDGGYSTLDLAFAAWKLPSTTALTLSDTTDTVIVGTTQTVGSISGSGTIALNTGSLTTSAATSSVFSGHLAGSGGILNVGSGNTLTLTGNNSVAANNFAPFSGTLALSGTLIVSSSGNLGTGTAPINMSGGTLSATETFAVSNPMVFYDNSDVNVAANQVLTLNGAISYQDNGQITTSGSLIKTGTGTVVLTNTSNSLYGLDIAAGTVQFSAAGNINSVTALEIDSGTLELLTNNTVSTSQNVNITTSTSTIAVDQNSTLTISGAVNDLYQEGGGLHGPAGGLTVSGQGTLILSGTNDYTLGTTINGNLSISSDQNLGATGTAITFGSTLFRSGSFFISEPGNLITTSNLTTSRPIVLGSSGGSFSPAAGTTFTVNGTISSAGSGVLVNGPGTLVLGGTNTFSGGVALSAGTLQISSDSNLGSYTAGSTNDGIYFAGGALTITGRDTTYRPVMIASGAVAGINAGSSTSFTFAGPITGAGSVNVTGNSGNIAFTAANTYSGGTTITNGGGLFAGPIPANSTTGPLGTGPVTLAGGSLYLNGGQLQSGTFAQQALSTSGYNQDVIVEESTSPTGFQSAVSTSFDNFPSKTSGYAFFEQGYIGPNNTNAGSTGLPHNGFINSAVNTSVNFKLQPYSSSNVLLLNPTSGENEGTLSLNTQGAFSELNILAAASNGAASGTVFVEFSDYTTAAFPFSVPDWFSSTPAAYSVNGRISLSDGSFQVVQGGYPRLYEIDLPIPAADQSKAVTGVLFDQTAGGTLGVFSLSGYGSLLSSTQSYPNNVIVTANSYISLSGSPTSTMGTLSLGSNTLAVEGPAGYTLTFANTVLSGNATVVSGTPSGPTVNLGTVTGSGSLTSYGKVNATSLPPVTYTQIDYSLTIANHGSSPKFVLQTGTLIIAGGTGAWTAQLDLTNNAAIITSGNLATITNQIASGYANGTWTGNGITSSTAATDIKHLTALGVILNNNGSGGALYSSFDGASAPVNSVIVSYTYYGDTNLSGTVDGTDYSRIDSGYLTHATGWYNGDFNYDGVIDGSDYTLIDNSYNTQGANLADEIASSTAQIGSGASVPEPAVIGLLATGALSLGRRRRAGPGRSSGCGKAEGECSWELR